MVKDQQPVVKLDSLRVAFDDERAVANAGLVLPASLAGRLGLEALVDEAVCLGGRTGGALPGRKVLSLVHGMLAGADSIDDMDVLRAGGRGWCLAIGCWRPRRWGRFCARSASGTCASSTGYSTGRCSGRGRRARGRARGGW